ncbi:MAG TPA: ABC-F family ATP-binding cassette domain-containing protein [Spirochaetia bacterium]|nr:ABC-F family ATP-binding cassette domain-containing protein [Spirochaetia bacterium]
MPLVSLSGVSVSYGERRLLDAVNLTIASRMRVALVGPNGSGKSTLMRILAGLGAPDTGSVVREKDTRVAYVPQSVAQYPAGPTLLEEAETAFERGAALVRESAELEERMGALSPGSPDAESLLWRHHELQERIEASGYHRRAEAIHRVLTGLGFSVEDFRKPCAAFSAGWQMRIALSRALLANPDILLLDEPTNYLDLEARNWLEEFLAQYPGGLLLVSHDRWFLDAVVQSVAEIFMSRVSVFSGNYSHYEEARSRDLESLMERWRQQQEEISRIEAFISRFRYNASKARLVQSRITQLDKMERIEVPPVVKSIRFSFPPPPASGRLVLSAEALSKSYGGRPVFSGVGFDVSKGDKLVVVGVNGAGKSTLLRLISEKEAPDSGTLRRGTGVVPAFYSQERADAWTSSRQVIEELEAVAPTSLIPELRTMLGSFLFRGDDVFKSVSVLSGGEKSRLALLTMLLEPANLLILDEPTNHLDLASKDVLLGALRDFPGTVIFVSHDRHFISHLATAVLELKDGRARYLPGDYDYYLAKSASDAAAAGPVPVPAASASEQPPADGARGSSADTRAEDKRVKSELRSLEREEAVLLQRLEDLEAERVRIEESMARPEVYSDGDRMKELRRRHDENQRDHAQAMQRWEQVDGSARAAREKLASRG